MFLQRFVVEKSLNLRLFGTMCSPKTLLLAAALFAAPQARAAGDLFAGSDKLREKTANTVRNANLDPVWLDGGAKMWFRTTAANGASEFHLVDCATGAKQPLFDHARLSEALKKAGVADEAASQLRLESPQPDPSAQTLAFSIGGKTWTWKAAQGELVPGDARGSDPLRPVPRVSGSGGPELNLRVRNDTGGPVSLWWLDSRGKRQAYGRVAPGGVSEQHTFSGHVWVITDAAGKDLMAFVADPSRAEIAVKGAEEIRWEERRPRRNREQEGPPRTIPGDKSPDGKWTAFLRDHNLFLRAEDGKETAMTTDGAAEDRYDGPFFWSPDSKRLAATRYRHVEERTIEVIRSSPQADGSKEALPKDQVLQPKKESWAYAKPGDPLSWRRPRLFDVAAATMLPVDESLFSNAWSIDEWHWAPDSSAFHFLFNQRGHQLLRIVALDAATGAARALFEERAETFVDYSQKSFLQWLDGTGEFIWMSERSGWNHLYLCDARTGAVKNAITSGEWVVRSVERTDVEGRQIEFKCMGIRPGQDPYHAHFARVNFDGTGLVILTEGDGTHRVEYSPDRGTFIDTWSRIDQPPVHELRNAADGRLLCELSRADITALSATGWPMPQRFSAPGRDGKTEIFGMILRPWGFDPAKKYPVIEYIYAGPHDFFVPKDFREWYRHWELGNLGFILVFIDGMGTNWRSRAFHDVAWRNLGDAGYPDRIAWMKAAAVAHPGMDLSRVGIFGGSAGGQNAMRALIAHGDFYRCAAADCGCHDNRMDKIWWNEAWMGWPIGPHYSEASNVDQAHRLKGHLLLTVGEMDQNVDPASTMQVVNALIKADKDFELLIVPNANHGAGESPYASRRRARFFLRHLLGVQPEAN